MPNDNEPFSNEEYSTTKTILVVEDDRDIGAFLGLALTQETPYHALLVADGFQALKIVREIKPDLFLLDYHLPSMDGIELYDHLHATEGLEQTPAILLSSNLPRKELEKRKMVGVRKPFELDTLLNTIAKAFD